MDLNDTPELAEYRQRVRGWLEEHANEAPRRRGREDPESVAAHRAWQGKLAGAGLAGRHLARGVRRPGPRPAAPGRGQPGDQPRRRARPVRPDRRRHARPDRDRARLRGAEAAPPRLDAGGRGGLVPAVLRARRGLGPRRRADAREARGRRRLARVGPEGVDHERPVRVVRAAARAHRRGPAQAPRPDDVHPADRRRGRERAPAAPDLRRRALQRGLPRRRPAGAGQRGRPRRRRLGRRHDHADVRAGGDRPRRRGLRLARRPLRHGADR